MVRSVVKRHTSFARPVLSLEKMKHCFTDTVQPSMQHRFLKTSMMLVSVVHALTHEFRISIIDIFPQMSSKYCT